MASIWEWKDVYGGSPPRVTAESIPAKNWNQMWEQFGGESDYALKFNEQPTLFGYSKSQAQIRIPMHVSTNQSYGTIKSTMRLGFKMGTDDDGQILNPDEYQIDSVKRFVPFTKTLKDFLYNSPTKGANVARFENIIGGADGTGIRVSWEAYSDSWRESLSDDLLVISQIDIYTNDESLEQQTKLQTFGFWGTSTLLSPSYDTVVPMPVGVQTNNGISESGQYMFCSLASITSNYASFSYSGTKAFGGLHQMSYITNFVGSPTNPYLIVPGDELRVSNRANFVSKAIYGTKTEWEKYFDTVGMPWSWDEDVVKNTDDPRLRRPEEPGQPNDPVDDDDGDGDNESDIIEYPVVSYVPTAFSRYWITPETLSNLKDFLFSGTFLDNIKRLWTNPAEYIVDLTYYPLLPNALNMTGELEEITVGDISTGTTGYIYPQTGGSYHMMGLYHIEPYYGSYLDYEPYTSISIFLPYIGVRPLDASRVTGHTLNVAYSFDFGTHQVTAHLGLDGGGFVDLGNALDSYTGSFGVSFPLSGTQANQMALNVLQQTSKIASSAGAIAGGVASGRADVAIGGAVNALESLMPGRISPESYGTLTPTAGLYAPQIPYLIINRPISAEPSLWQAEHGYSSAYSGAVSEFTGYLQALDVDLVRGDGMTDDEAESIISLIKGGILI